MPNTILTYAATGNLVTTPSAAALAALKKIPIDLTLPQIWGLLPISDVPALAFPALNRTIVCQMTPTVADAAGTVVMTGDQGAVKSITMTNPGGLYGMPPVLTFVGGNPLQPAQAVAVCAVGGCIVLLGGAGYTGATIVTFKGQLAPGGVQATGTVTVAFGAVTGIVMTNTGGPYVQPPAAVISDTGGGAGAEVVAGLSLSGATVTYGGTGYQAAPTAVFTPLFKQMVPDSAGNANQQATLKGWMDQVFSNAMELPFKSTTTAS